MGAAKIAKSRSSATWASLGEVLRPRTHRTPVSRHRHVNLGEIYFEAALECPRSELVKILLEMIGSREMPKICLKSDIAGECATKEAQTRAGATARAIRTNPNWRGRILHRHSSKSST